MGPKEWTVRVREGTGLLGGLYGAGSRGVR